MSAAFPVQKYLKQGGTSSDQKGPRQSKRTGTDLNMSAYDYADNASLLVETKNINAYRKKKSQEVIRT
jgi:hypothetical protein